MESHWRASIKVHCFLCSRGVKMLIVHQIALNFTSICWIAGYTDRSNENGTLTNKPYRNEGNLNGDKIH